MKIHVIDNSGQIQPHFIVAETDISFFSDEVKAINTVETDLPELIFLGHSIRKEETAAFIDLLLTFNPLASIVLFGDDLTDQEVIDCLLAGAKGYLNSRDIPLHMDKIIKAITLGEAWITRSMTSRLIDTIRRQNRLDTNHA